MSEQINRYRVGIYLIQCILLNLILYFYLGEIFKNDSRHHYISIVLIIAIIIADYLSRAYITNIFAFFFVHLVFITGTAVIPVTILDKILTSIISIMFLIISVVFWKSEDKKNDVNIFEIPLGMLVFIFPVYIHTSIYYSSFLKWFIYISAIIFLILCLIRNYLNKIRIQLLSNNTYTKSLYQSFKANFYMINLFNVGLIIVFTCVNIIYSDEISTSIAKFFKMIGKFLLGFLPKMGKNDKLQETTKLIEETSFNGSTEESMTLQAPGKTHSSGLLFNYLFKLLIIILLIGVIYALYKFVIEFLHRKHSSDDIVEKINEKDDVHSLSRKKKVHEHLSFFSIKDHIRKIYIHKVNSCIKKDSRVKVRKSLTPDEIENLLKNADSLSDYDYNTLTKLYEKARYSNLEMTKEDVTQAKNASISKK